MAPDGSASRRCEYLIPSGPGLVFGRFFRRLVMASGVGTEERRDEVVESGF